MIKIYRNRKSVWQKATDGTDPPEKRRSKCTSHIPAYSFWKLTIHSGAYCKLTRLLVTVVRITCMQSKGCEYTARQCLTLSFYSVILFRKVEIAIVTTILENLFSITDRTRRPVIFYEGSEDNWLTILLYKVSSLTVCGFDNLAKFRTCHCQ